MHRKLFILSMLFAGVTHAQLKRPVSPGEVEYQRLQDGMKALKASLSVERADYLQGEGVCFTVSLSNPTNSQVMAVPAFPLTPSPLRFLQRNREGEWEAMLDTTTTVFSPRQST